MKYPLNAFTDGIEALLRFPKIRAEVKYDPVTDMFVDQGKD